MQLLVTYRDCPPTMQPAIRPGDLLPEPIGEILENICVIEWLAVQRVARARAVSTETSRRSLLLPEVRRDKDIIRVADDGDMMRGDRVDYVAEAMVKPRVVMKHAAIGEPAGCDEVRKRLRARSRGVPSRSRPLQFVDRREEAADPMVSRLRRCGDDNPHWFLHLEFIEPLVAIELRTQAT